MSKPFVSIQTWKYFRAEVLEDALIALTNAVAELTDDEKENINHIEVSRPDDENPFYTVGCMFSWEAQK